MENLITDQLRKSSSQIGNLGLTQKLPLTEKEVLNKLGIPDFRHLSKDKVMQFVSMISDMEPDVAKKAIEQFPEYSHMILEVLQDFGKTMKGTLEANTESSNHCHEIYQEIVSSLKKNVERDDLSFEEKKYYIEQMKELARMQEVKDSENKEFWIRIARIAACFGIVCVTAGFAALGGKVNIPKLKI